MEKLEPLYKASALLKGALKLFNKYRLRSYLSKNSLNVRSAWPLVSVLFSMGFTVQPAAEEMDPYHAPACPRVDTCNLAQ